METISPKLFSQISGEEFVIDERRKSLSSQPGWFYLRLQTVLNETFRSYLFRNGIDLSPNNRIESGWYKDYFNSSQLSFINCEKSFSLFPIKKTFKQCLSTEETLEKRKYIVEAANGWVPPRNTRIKHISQHFFVVEGKTDYNTLLSSQMVASVKDYSSRYALNRGSVGFVQSGVQEGELVDGSFISRRIINERGLNGEGEVVTFVDSGVDALHPFFYDPNNKVPINVTSNTHRKIKKIFAFADGKDIAYGHGSHVCGIAVGESYTNDSSISMYNGVAPKAKLIMGDIGYINEGYSMSGDYDIEELSRNMEELGSFINSNSWGGAEDDCYLTTYVYNLAAYEFPNQLFVFASGNSGRAEDLACPSDGKNILSVGGLGTLPLSDLSSTSLTQLFVECGDKRIMVNGALRSTDIFTHNVVNNKNIYQMKKALTIEDKMEGMVLVKENIKPDEIKKSLANGVEAIISTVDTRIDLPIPSVYTTDINSFNAIKELDNITIYARPKVEKKVLQKAGFTSFGPSKYNGIKPEILVPGSSIMSASSGNPNDETPRPAVFSALTSKGGTSMACPHASGMAAIFRQFFTQGWYPTMKKGESESIIPSSSLLRSMFITASRPLNSNEVYPNFMSGYGTPALVNVLTNETGLRIIDNVEIGPKKMHSYKIHVTGNAKPLIVTMAYIDYPKHVEAKHFAILAANINLIVIDPNGKQYKGNNREEIFSTNERVLINENDVIPNSDYEIVILSNDYPSDIPIEKYAIVVSGDFENSDTKTNPRFLQRTESSKLKCKNGVLTENGCKCNANYLGNLCESEFSTVIVNDYNTHTSSSESIKYYVTDIKHFDSASPPKIEISNREGNVMHLAASTRPFQSIYDAGVIHCDKKGTIRLEIDNARDKLVYFAMAVSSRTDKSCSFQVTNKIPEPTPTEVPPTETESAETTQTEETETSEIEISTETVTIETESANSTETQIEDEKKMINTIIIVLIVILALVIISITGFILVPLLVKECKRRIAFNVNVDEIEARIIDDMDVPI